MRIIFMGTPAFSVPSLAEILGAGHEVAAVYTQPPRRSGRGMSAHKTPVHQFAEEAGLKVLTPKSLRGEVEQNEFASFAPDVAVVVAYGLILPKAILDTPRYGCLNLHASKLPRWRGAAPIQRAIMAGDTETAAMVMRMEEGLDTGPICLAEQVPIGPDMTAGELHDALSVGGADLLVRALAALSRGSLTETAQSKNGISYASKINKSEARINFDRPAQDVHNHIRGLSPFPGAWFEANLKAVPNAKPERIKVLRCKLITQNNESIESSTNDINGSAAAGSILDDKLTIACRSGAVRLIEVQRAGKRPMTAEEFIRGANLQAGQKIS